MIFGEAHLTCHVGGHLFFVACQHHKAHYTILLQCCHGIGSIIFYLVTHHDMTFIFALHRHMDDGAHVVTGVPVGAHGVHHLAIAHAHRLAIHAGPHTLTCHLGHIFHVTTICLVGVGVAQ